MSTEPRTRLALLATLSNLHLEPVGYDLASLRAVVETASPDLLLAEITPEMWEGGDLSRAAVEVRDALAPVVAATDVVLVPIAPSEERFADFGPVSGWRRGLVQTIDRALVWSQRRANTAEAINGPLFEAFCHPLCLFTEMSWTAARRRAWDEQNNTMVSNILKAARRDAGRRILVAVQCQRVHKIGPELRKLAPELDLMNFWEL